MENQPIVKHQFENLPQDKKDGKGKYFQIQYGYRNPDLFPKNHEWTIWTTALASTFFMIFWFWHVKRGTEEINEKIRLVQVDWYS